MNKLSDIVLKPLESNKYLKPMSMVYKQNNVTKSWDMLSVHKSVAIILLNTTRNVMIFVRQFRPPVYMESVPVGDRINNQINADKYPAELGITLELCAGIVDKEISLAEIAAEEIMEECGYKVEPSNIELISSFPSSVGTTGSIQHLYYCEVTDAMRVSQGGGIHDEIIDVVEMTIPEVRSYVSQKKILSPPSFLFAVQWFLANKAK